MTETSAAPAVKAPPGDGDLSITELVEFEPTRMDGVKSGATGFPFLIMKAAASPAGETSPETSEVHGKPLWHAAAAALARLGAKAPDIDPAELFKAVNAAGEVDEAPDIAGGKQAIALIGKLIEYEAQELQAGCLDEVCDISLLCQAADCLRCWLGMESSDAMKGCGCCPACTGPGDGCCEACGDVGKAVGGANGGGGNLLVSESRDSETGFWTYGPLGVAKDSRTFTAAERKQHAKDGNALPDGSYPIPDKDALRRAAILARSGHGDVKAAKRLIARRARELGVANPLETDDKASKATAEAVVAEEATTVDTEAQEITGGLQKAIDEAIAKALDSSKERFTALEDKLAKAQADLRDMASRPVHGGPVLSAASVRSAPRADGTDWAAKAAEAESLANTLSDQSEATNLRQLAAQYRAKIPAS